MLKRKARQEDQEDNAPADTPELNDLELSFSRVPMFSSCSREQLERVARIVTIRDAQHTRQGAEVARLDSGDFFGELDGKT
jgi:hypothetical protein